MMKGQIAGLMRQAQQMQENMKKAQEALAEIIVEGASGGGLVKVSMSCRHDVKRVTIDPSLLADDKDMLEDLVAAAFNDALRKAEATSQEKRAAVMAGRPTPAGMRLTVGCKRRCPELIRSPVLDRPCAACRGSCCVRPGAWPSIGCSVTLELRIS